MNDIIVTTPRDRMNEAALEAKEMKNAGGGYYYREYTTPPPVVSKSRVYYVEDGYIRGFALVLHIENDNGCYVMWMRADSWQWIKPIPMKGFQRWRYMNIPREKIEIVGNWLDPRPALP